MTEQPARRRFQKLFQAALKKRVTQGRPAEECFGIVWEQTLEEVPLSETEERLAFRDLIDWTKDWMR